MNILSKINKVCILLAVMLGVSISNAAEYSRIQPWLDDETIAVLSIDLDSINTQVVYDELMYYVAEYLDQADADEAINKMTTFKVVVDGYLAQFKNDGIKSLNCVISMYDLPYFYLVVPHKPGSECASVKALVQMLTLTELKNVPFISLDTFENTDDVMFIGKADTLNRLRANSNIDSPEVQKALKYVDNYGVKLVYTPSGSLQRVIQETLFPVSQDNDIASDSDITDSVQWASVGLSLNKSLKLSYVAQSKSVEAANRAIAIVDKLQEQILKERPWIKQQYPQIDSMLAVIKPDVSGDMLQKKIDNMQIRKSLAPIMLECFSSARLQANIQISMQTVKGIVTACLIHMNDHKGKMPNSLDELITTADMPAKGLVSPLENIGTGYVFRGSDLNDKASAAMIGVYERFERNCKTYYVVGFMDGHSEYMSKENFQKVLVEDNRLRRLSKFDEKPEE